MAKCSLHSGTAVKSGRASLLVETRDRIAIAGRDTDTWYGSCSTVLSTNERARRLPVFALLLERYCNASERPVIRDSIVNDATNPQGLFPLVHTSSRMFDGNTAWPLCICRPML